MWNENQWAYNLSKVQNSRVMISSIKYMDITPNLLLVSHDYALTQTTQMVHCCLRNCEQIFLSDIKMF